MPDVLNELFWQRCDALLAQRRIKPNRVSVFSFMSRNAYTNAHKIKSAPGIDFVDGIARCLDVSIEYLVAGTREGEPYIPADVPQPANPDFAIKEARRIAGPLIRPAAIALVLRQKPDPRMGVGRILELFYRADRMLADRERRSAKKRTRTRRAPHASR